MGQLAAQRAMDLALERAEQGGHGAVSVRNSTHCGAMAFWSLQAVPRRAIGTAVTNAGINMMPTFDQFTAEGIYAQVHVEIVNNTAVQRAFPFEELVLRDEQGRVFAPDSQVPTVNQAGWFSPFPPSLPTPGFVVFDIATDAEGPFILESTTDPTFRVLVETEVRG